MIANIPNVAPPEDVAWILDKLTDAVFGDGRVTAGTEGRRVKHNLQLQDRTLAAMLSARLTRTLSANRDIVDFVLPTKSTMPLFSRYDAGMSYGNHVDTAIMGHRQFVRSDLAMTVFLSEPESYDGGSLSIDTAVGPVAIKLPAGSAVIYPATSVHRVEEVTRGRRYAAVMWFQSMIADADDRSVVVNLAKSVQRLSDAGANREDIDRLGACLQNLIRKWAQP